MLGLGFGCTTQVLVLAAQNAVDRKDLGVATSTATFVRQMGGTFGTAIFGTVLVNQLVAGINERLPGGVGDGCDPKAITGAPSAILRCPPEVREPIQKAFVDALNVTFFVAVPLHRARVRARVLPAGDPARRSARRRATKDRATREPSTPTGAPTPTAVSGRRTAQRRCRRPATARRGERRRHVAGARARARVELSPCTLVAAARPGRSRRR